jgi:hypothetical protein
VRETEEQRVRLSSCEGEEGSWEMGLQGRRGDAEGYIEIAREGMQFGKRGFGRLIKVEEVEKQRSGKRWFLNGKNKRRKSVE